MARYCIMCGAKLSIFKKDNLCDSCKHKLEQSIIRTRELTQEQYKILSDFSKNKSSKISFFNKIYKQLEKIGGIQETEIDLLQKIQEALNLTNEDIDFDNKIRPYIYVISISKGDLPSVNLRIEGSSQPILKKGEKIHFADFAILKEQKSIRRFVGGSQGVSFRIMKGVRYRIGGFRGHLESEQTMVETSRGTLLITNKRLFLHPAPGYKPVSIPLNKILSYNCFKNGIEIYKEGRGKGYFFSINKPGSIEIFGLCLSHLLSQ